MAPSTASSPLSRPKFFRRLLGATLTLAVCGALTQDPGPEPVAMTAVDSLAAIKSDGVLKVVTRRGYTSWFDEGGAGAGFEHDLAKGFAEHIGVEIEFTVADTPGELLTRLVDGDFHLGAGSISEGSGAKEGLTLSESFIERRYALVQHADAPTISGLGELAEHSVVVPSGSNAVNLLQAVTASYPLVRWNISTNSDTEGLLKSVADGRLAYTIADTNTITVMQQHLPALKIAHTFTEDLPIAWAFHPESHRSVRDAAAVYLEKIRRHGELARLEERYFDSASHRSHYDLDVFRKRIADTLPEYRHLFIEAGHANNVDWRLVAALSYQESMWNPHAESYTGVRGIMQLTKATAKTFKVDREDVPQAIMAGARYVSLLIERLPESIDLSDRKWMALASYNVGPGHLDDARDLTAMQGGNPDSWRDVKRHLPMLSDPDFYQFTRFGAARGGEAVHLVTRVRSFYDVLVRQESTAQEYKATPTSRTPMVQTTIL